MNHSQNGEANAQPSGNTVAQPQEIVKGNTGAKLSLKDSASLAREIARIQKEGIAGKRTDAEIQADIRAVVDEAYQGFIGEYGVIEPGEKPAIADAETRIRKVGWAQSLSDWALYNNAANSGDTETAMTILNAMVQHQRSAAWKVCRRS